MHKRLAVCCIGMVTCTQVVAQSTDASLSAYAKDAQKQLDVLLNVNQQDNEVYGFLLGHKERDVSRDMLYAPFFTSGLLTEWARLESEKLKSTCDGQYIQGEMCGFDYHPVLCVSDFPDQRYYHVEKITSNNAQIAVFATYRNTLIARYSMVLSDGRWQLDGVQCAGGESVGMLVNP